MSSPAPRGARGGRRRVLFVGMMGAGKSTVASLVAARLGWPVLDTDTVVEQRAGASVAEIFARDGEAEFRSAEAAAIAGLDEIDGPLVVSVGGGAVLSEDNRRALRAGGTVVWLRARPATLAARVGNVKSRPVLAGSGLEAEEALEKLVAERQPYYEQVADISVDVDDISPAEAVELVMEALKSALPL